jgi:hypothetical protein
MIGDIVRWGFHSRERKLFVTKRVDGVEPSSPIGRIEAEADATYGRNA